MCCSLHVVYVLFTCCLHVGGAVMSQCEVCVTLCSLPQLTLTAVRRRAVKTG